MVKSIVLNRELVYYNFIVFTKSETLSAIDSISIRMHFIPMWLGLTYVIETCFS